jgi:hypothetical protein
VAARHPWPPFGVACCHAQRLAATPLLFLFILILIMFNFFLKKKVLFIHVFN